MPSSYDIKTVLILFLIGFITACGGGGSGGNSSGGSSSSSGGSSSGGNNIGMSPVAVSRVSNTVVASSAVILDASFSYDPDGSITDYQWSQKSGIPVSINNTDTASASFSSPAVAETTELLFTLTVTDNDSQSSSIDVVVFVKPPAEDFTNLTGPVVLGGLDSFDIAQNVIMHGDHAYVADWESGLRVVDISNPRSPNVISTIDTTSRARDIIFSTDGNTGFVGDEDRVYAINVSDPAAPFIEDEYPEGATSVFIEGDRLYAANYESFFVVDVSDPTNLVMLGSYDFSVEISPSNDLHVVEGMAFLARHNEGLLILNAKEPADISRLGGLDSEYFAERLVARGDHVFMTDEDAGTKVIDISNPALPQLVTSIPLYEGLLGANTSEAHSIKLVGDTAYIGTHYGTFQVWDITDLLTPLFLGEVATITESTGLDVSGSLAVIVGHSGLNVIDVSAPMSLKSQADFIRTELNVTGSSLIFNGNTVYDVTNPADPIKANLGLTSSWNPTFGTTIYSLENGNASSTGTLSIYNYADILNPVVQGPGSLPQLSKMPANSFFYSSQLQGNTLFASYRSGEFQLIDTSDPNNLNTRQLDLSAFGYLDVLGFNGDTVYAVDSSDIAVVDISDLGNPVELGAVEYFGSRIRVEGDYVYMTGFFDFRVYDMSTPSSPELVVTIPTEISNRMSQIDNLLFIGLGQSGSGKVMVVDISQPEYPAYTHLESGSKTVDGVLANDDAIVTTSYDADAIRVYDISPYFP